MKRELINEQKSSSISYFIVINLPLLSSKIVNFENSDTTHTLRSTAFHKQGNIACILRTVEGIPIAL